MLRRIVSSLFTKSSKHFSFCELNAILKFTRNVSNQLQHSYSFSSNASFSSAPNTFAIPSNKEKDLLVKNDPDTFGTLSPSQPEKPLSEEDLKEQTYLESPPKPRKLSTKQYADIIKDLIRQRKIKEAIDVLEVRMIKEDRVKPENYIYNLILGACGRVGYTKKAFKLYNDMKKRDLAITGGTYTALFNACSNSPWPEDGLKRAHHLRQIMIEKGVQPNETNYNCMIKAFGRCGDLKTAFLIADEMLEKKFRVDESTFNFLLQSVISDEEAGFRHVLLVWRKLIKLNIKPNIFSYNLLLRSVRDCSVGDTKVLQDVISSLIRDEKKLESKENSIVALPANCNQDQVDVALTSTDSSLTDSLPNLISDKPTLGSVEAIHEITKPADRLLLIGGVKGVLSNMDENSVKPDIKTFTLFLDIIPPTLTAEQYLVKIMKKYKIKPDVDFFNMLIKKRSLRFDYESAKEVLGDIHASKLRPDLITYGVLSLGCTTSKEARVLLQEIENAGYRLNMQILGPMFKNACIRKNFNLILEIMEIVVKQRIKVSSQFLRTLEDFFDKCRELSKTKKDKVFTKGFELVRMRYSTWSKEIEKDETEDAHPWEQFRRPTETNVKHYKDPFVRFKPQVKSRFRQSIKPKVQN